MEIWTEVSARVVNSMSQLWRELKAAGANEDELKSIVVLLGENSISISRMPAPDSLNESVAPPVKKSKKIIDG